MDFLIPKLIILSAPSGTGKTSIIKQAKQIFPNLTLSVSYTTREPREGEVDGKDYFFVDREEFIKLRDNQEFIEWAEVFGNFYGTSKKFIQNAQKNNQIVILDIDVQGALQLKKIKDLSKSMIFIRPPSLEELKNRLIFRNTEDEESLKKRLGNAEKEMNYQNQYDYTIINNQLDQAVNEFIYLILKETIDFSTTNLLVLKEDISKILPPGEIATNGLMLIFEKLLPPEIS